jgi:hypothetical protein
VSDEEGDIAPAFPKRGNSHGDRAEPEIEILPESSGGDLLLEVPVGGADNPDIHRARLLVTHTFVGPLL